MINQRLFLLACALVAPAPFVAAQEFGVVQAQGLGVLQELNTCDYLGVPGMTLASDTHCLQLRGGVSYELELGQFRDEVVIARTSHDTKLPVGLYGVDWNTKVKTWLKLVDVSETDFGPSRAVIQIGTEEEQKFWGSAVGYTTDGPMASSRGSNELKIDEAFVEIGDATKLMIGKKGSVAIFGNDRPFNYLGLFNTSSYEGGGVGIDNDSEKIGGHVVHATSRLNNQWTISGGIEAIGSDTGGTGVASIAYNRDGLSGHLTGLLFDLSSADRSWMLHSGASAYFDGFSLRSAVAYHANAKHDGIDRIDAMASAEGRFRSLTFAVSSELIHDGTLFATNFIDYGFGASVGFPLHRYVSGNVGTRAFIDGRTGLVTGQVAGQVNAVMTEVFAVGAEAGVYFGSKIAEQKVAGAFHNDVVGYVGAHVNVTPGGGVTGHLKGEFNTEGGYKLTVRAGKEFK
ncbi:hypothetical protein JHC09_02545 [Devosia sp. MC532]|uniref:hypothetical protein n=1 Tax=Devosia sp. MC532 TaxID=2799788 RepID=UPI0018F4C58B|nr:hypothetical protein [Devosia sp. MC532]MBJ7576758.1 hypothetical protein [Devosia sp. MC532]